MKTVKKMKTHIAPDSKSPLRPMGGRSRHEKRARTRKRLMALGVVGAIAAVCTTMMRRRTH